MSLSTLAPIRLEYMAIRMWKEEMKKLILFVCVFSLLLSVTALAAGDFNAGVTITQETGKISVTVSTDSDAVLSEQKPTLSVPCSFAAAKVTLNGAEIDATIANGEITFEVAQGADKYAIRRAVEELFGVEVEKVNTMKRKGQLRRYGRYQGYQADKKLAIVKLTDSSKGIEFFEGMATQE